MKIKLQRLKAIQSQKQRKRELSVIKFSLPALTGLGFQSDDVITTLELRMKCGIGKCGRCNIGHKYVCLDGPVFTLTQLNEMPNEY